MIDALAISKRKGGSPLTMLTAYNQYVARIVAASGVDIILVGDSLGMIEFGHTDTRGVTVEMMCRHIEAVRAGASDMHIVGDMPLGSYDTASLAAQNAQRMIAAGANSVKVEGPCTDQIRHLSTAHEIPVLGHVGLLPQTQTNYKRQGTDSESAQAIINDALAITDAGAYAVVIEHVPDDLGAKITATIDIPTISIGAGGSCDGQVLVTHDILGLTGATPPPFSRQYVDLADLGQKACKEWVADVLSGNFPDGI
jgi:3-methyl-2-oxobutanoate hydroxymethyltransferase